MPERRRRDFLTPLLLALAADPAAGVLGLQALHPGLLGGGVRRAAAGAGPEAPVRGARRPAHARVRDPGAADDGRDPGADPHVAVPARPPDGALPRLGQAPAARRARGDAALLGGAAAPLPGPQELDRLPAGADRTRPRGWHLPARRRRQRPAAERARPRDPRRDRPGAVPADALLPAARRRSPEGRAAAGVALFRRAGAPDLRPPRPDHQGRAAGRGGGAGGAGHPRGHRLPDVRRALALRVGHGRDPGGDRAARRIPARLDARVRLPGAPGCDGTRPRPARLLPRGRERQRQRRSSRCCCVAPRESTR